MKAKTLVIVFLTIVLVSCAQASTPAPTNPPQPTSTSTPEPTFTPSPIEISGLLFLDANGSGLRDDASFICPETNATPKSLEYFFPNICTSSNIGKLVTVQEPSLINISVCYNDNCTTTGVDGVYSLSLYGITDGEMINLKVVDPNAQTPELALKYFNKWNKAVVIPSTTVNGIDIPEQNLNDAKVYPLGSISAKVGAENQVGLTQGFLTLPFRDIDLENPIIWNGFDIYGKPNDRDGNISNYYGISSKGNPFIPPIVGQLDSHSGLDFASPIGTYTVASMNGAIDNIVRKDNEIALFLTYSGAPYWSNYGHLGATNPNLNSKNVFRGQIIAETGDSGDNNTFFGSRKVPQLHWDIAKYPGDSLYVDPFATTIPLKDGLSFYGNTTSLWTVYNLPVFPLP